MSGCDPEFGVEEVNAYDDMNDRWEERAEMPSVSGHGSCAVLDSDIYIVGGNESENNMRYNTETDQWTIIPKPANPYVCAGAFEMFGKIVLVPINLFDAVEGDWMKDHHFPHGYWLSFQ
jgi:hypothetical protein